MAQGVAQWFILCLPYLRFWVPSPKRKEIKKYHLAHSCLSLNFQTWEIDIQKYKGICLSFFHQCVCNSEV